MSSQFKSDPDFDISEDAKGGFLFFRSRISYKTLLSIVLLLLLIAVFIGTGIRGVDFGDHWDERPAQVIPLERSLKSRTLLPSWYIYPSVNYWLNISVAIPSAVTGAVKATQTGESRLQYLLNEISSHEFLLRLRTSRIIISAFSIIWVYLLVWFWKRNRLQALLAASILGLSWEIAYHSRWVATDVIMMQFGVLVLLGLVLALYRTNKRGWVRFSAVAAGLACGTKYPGGIFLLPVLLTAYQVRSKEAKRSRVFLSVFEVLMIFSGTYLLTTPGTVLQPTMFLNDLARAVNTYGAQGHYGYTVSPGLDHLSRIFTYLGLVLFSRYSTIALFFSLFSFFGAYAVWKEARRLWVLFVLFPMFYILYFGSQQVMIARNLLVIAPFISILSAQGIIFLSKCLPHKYLRLGLLVITIAALAVNAVWLIYAAESIQDRGTDRFVYELVDYVEDHPEKIFNVSNQIYKELEAVDMGGLTNITTDVTQDVEVVVLYASEAMPLLSWPANIHSLTIKTFGPQEVNFNYYPTWVGNDRIIVMNIEQARDLELSMWGRD